MDVLKADSMSIVSPMEGQGRGSALDHTEHSLELGHIRLATDSEKEGGQWMCSKPTQ